MSDKNNELRQVLQQLEQDIAQTLERINHHPPEPVYDLDGSDDDNLNEPDDDNLNESDNDSQSEPLEQFDFTKDFKEKSSSKHNKFYHINSYEEIVDLYNEVYAELEELKAVKKIMKAEEHGGEEILKKIGQLRDEWLQLSDRRRDIFLPKLHKEMIQRKDQILSLTGLIQKLLRELYKTDYVNVYPIICDSDYTEDCEVPVGTFQFMLNIHTGYNNECSISDSPIIFGVDYPYVLTCTVSHKEEGKTPKYQRKGIRSANFIIRTEKDWKKYVHYLPNLLSTDMQEHIVVRMNELYLENEELKSRPGGEYAQDAQRSFEDIMCPKDDKLTAKQIDFLQSSEELKRIVESLEAEQRRICKYENIHIEIQPTTLIIKDAPDLRYKLLITEDNDLEFILLSDNNLLLVRDNIFTLRLSSGEEVSLNEGQCGQILIRTPTPELWKAYIRSN